MKVSEYSQGQPCWSELATHDWQGAKDFYQRLFGWQMADIAMLAGAFSMFTLEGDDLGTIYQLPASQASLAKSQWGIYFATEDVDAVIARAKAAGGELLVGPQDVGHAGRMAHLADPEGARFAVWQSKRHLGAKRRAEPGALCWVELACRTPARAQAFYSEVFGWDSRVSVNDANYYEWLIAGTAHGGMLQMPATMDDMAPQWLLYFQVRDCDACAERAAALGGKICLPPADIPGIGRFASLTDPAGSLFSIIAINQAYPR